MFQSITLFCLFIITLFISGSTLVSADMPTLSSKRVLIDRVDASVNSSIILHSDIRNFLKTLDLRIQLDPLFSSHPIAKKRGSATSSEVREFLIEEDLIAQLFPVTDGEVEQEITSIQNNNHLTREALKSALADKGFSFSEYFELIRTSISKRNLFERDIRPKVSITDADIENYFFNHYSKDPNSPRSFHLQIISILFSSYKTPQAAYDRAKEALKEIQAGHSFEDVAKRMSDDPSASSGGELGTLTEDQMSSNIREEVKKLQIGQISGILGGTSLGQLFILKLAGIQSNESHVLQEKKEEIRTKLVTAEYEHQIHLWLDRQKQSAFIHRAGESPLKEIPLAQ